MKNVHKRKNSIGNALRTVRRSKDLSQEDFDVVSSRTYVSSLERGMKSPTLQKLDSLAEVMEVHPLTLLAMAYLHKPATDSPGALLNKVQEELIDIQRFLQSIDS